MKRKIGAALVALALGVGGLFTALPAFADEAPPVEETSDVVVQEETPAAEVVAPAPVEQSVVVEEAPAPEEPAVENSKSTPTTKQSVKPVDPRYVDISWVLPESWNDPDTVPFYSPEIFPQDRLYGDAPACRWLQNDTYKISNKEDAIVLEGLGDVLTQGEDSSIYHSHTFTFTGGCEPEIPTVLPMAPEVKDKCGTVNDHFGLPANTADVSYTRDGKNIVASISSKQAGATWGDLSGTGYTDNGDGTATYHFDNYKWTDELCPPNHMESIDGYCGYGTVHLSNPASTEGEANQATASFIIYVDGSFYGAYALAVGETQDVVINFPEDSGDHTIVLRTGPAQGDKKLAEATIESDCLPEVIVPEPPTVGDKCGPDYGPINIPGEYINGDGFEGWVTDHGYYMTDKAVDLTNGEGNFTISFLADAGYTTPEGNVMSWTFKLTNKPCPTDTPDTPGGSLALTGTNSPVGPLLFGAFIISAGIALVVARIRYDRLHSND